MALLFATGFELTTTLTDLFDAFGTGGGGNVGAVGRNSGKALDQNGANNMHSRKNLSGNIGHIIGSPSLLVTQLAPMVIRDNIADAIPFISFAFTD